MKKLTLILAGLLLAASYCFAQPEPIQHQLTLTTAFTNTDSVRLKSNEVPIAVELIGVDITNATAGVLQYSRQRVPTVWTTLLEVDAATDYALNFADSSGTPLQAGSVYILLGSSGTDSDDYLWVRIGGLTAEAADKVFTLITRYI